MMLGPLEFWFWFPIAIVVVCLGAIGFLLWQALTEVPWERDGG